jgi:hypothetical protein
LSNVHVLIFSQKIPELRLGKRQKLIHFPAGHILREACSLAWEDHFGEIPIIRHLVTR